MSTPLLLVEDDDTLGFALRVALREAGYEVRWCRDLRSARAAWSEEAPRLVILDLGLPDGDGLDLLREQDLDQTGVAVLILTARGTVEARVEGLNAGADDYLTKPFELPELLARLQALARRLAKAPPAPVKEVVGALEVDFENHEATVSGEPIELTELELKLLRYLLSRRGQLVSREELLEKVWNRSPSERTRTVDVYVSRLRRHIEPEADEPGILVNVRGVGYRLT